MRNRFVKLWFAGKVSLPTANLPDLGRQELSGTPCLSSKTVADIGLVPDAKIHEAP